MILQHIGRGCAARVCLAVGLFASGAGSAAEIFLECERLANPGGWTVDAQFMDQMGSPYLLAHGLGTPVADATGTFEADEAGEYTAFVRTKNWTAHWGDAAGGTFRLVVNGTALPETLGTGAPEWHWQKAGRVTLAKGANAVALRDLTGFDGRCDAIVFTRDADPDVARLSSLRQSGDAASREFSADLVVCGGGIAGLCTAVTAARLGLKVALVEARPIFGGANSSEVRVHLGGVQNLPPYVHLGDVLSEFGPAQGGNAAPPERYEDGRKARIVAREKNITAFLHTRIAAAEVEGGDRIRSVTGVHAVTGERTRFTAPLFVDCTGDGAVGFLAGAEWRMGRESRVETGEEMAPLEADDMTMGASVQWYAEKMVEGDGRAGCAFPLRDWMLKFDETNGSAGTHGDWNWETGMMRDQIRDFERIRDYGMLVAYSNWAYAKNASREKAKLADWALAWVAYVSGKRESRRLIGDHVLTQQDIFDYVDYPDGTCKTTWPVDLHYPVPKIDAKDSFEQFRSTCTHNPHYAYPIPYRCLYSRNVRNLFMAGRNISVTHVALGSVRVQRTTGMMGEVVGRAAALCKRHGCLPRDVYAAHLDELKALMLKSVGTGRDTRPQAYNGSHMLHGEPAAKTPVAQAKPRKGTAAKRICCIGDSITEGSERDGFVSYRWELDRLLKARGFAFDFAGKTVDARGFAHEAKCGRTAWGTFDRLYIGMGEANPDIVILHCGHNADAADPKTVASLTRANRAIVAEARSTNPHVVVLLAQVIESGKLPKYAYIPELNRNLAALAKELDTPESRVIAVDLPSVFDWKTDTVADRVHPNARGAAKIARAFADALAPFLTAPATARWTSRPSANATD